MNLKDKLIIEDYRKNKADFERLGEIVHAKLREICTSAGITPMTVGHRVKSEDSLLGKLYRSGDWYKTFDDLMDILGGRIVLYFADEVDVIGKKVEEAFDIDWEYSVDKGTLLDADSFGYLSLHYICTLRADEGYPQELLGKKFEIQVRTALQHIWSDIDHDIAYKSQFGVPREIKRGFSRLAGLLELADAEFMRVRDSMKEYTAEIRKKIEENTADAVNIDLISLKEYMLHNKEMRKFLDTLAKIEGSEIAEVNPEAYIDQLHFLNITTLGGLQDMLKNSGELAYQMAEKTLKGTELDILSSNVALRFLCRAHLVTEGYTREKAVEFLKLSVGDAKRAEMQVKRLFDLYRK